MASSPSPLREDTTEEMDDQKSKQPSDLVKDALNELTAKNSDKGPRHPQDQ
jgi:hypothetical protein